MTQNWFYADRTNQQQGPVTAAWLAGAYRDGTVGAATLVWREGLAGWVPLSQIAAQLGLVVVGAPPPPARAAGRPTIAKPQSSGSGAIIAIVVAVVLVAFLAIVAAIALPAYQDYTIRARVSEALVRADAVKLQVYEFHEEQKRCPANGEGGIGTPTSYAGTAVTSLQVGATKGGACTIEIRLHGTSSAINAKTLTFTMGEAGQWSVHSDLAPKYLPAWLR